MVKHKSTNFESDDEKDFVIVENSQEKDLIFVEPIFRGFNVIEKLIRKSPVLSKMLLRVGLINFLFPFALTSQTEEIPNSLYLTKFSKDETILDGLINTIGIKFNSQELEKRVECNVEILNIFIKNKRFPFDKDNTNGFLLTKVDGNITYLECLLENEQYIINLSEHIKSNKEIEKIVFHRMSQIEKYSDYDIDIIEQFIYSSSKDTLLSFYKRNFVKIKMYMEKLKFAIKKNLDENIVKYFIELEEYQLLGALPNDLLLCQYDNNNTILNILLKNTDDYCYGLSNETIKQLIINNRFRELEKVYINLLKKIDGEKTILEMLLEKKDALIFYRSLWKKIEYNITNDIRFAEIYLNFCLKSKKFPYLLLGATKEILDTKLDSGMTILEKVLSEFYANLDMNRHFIVGVSKFQKYALLYRFNGTTLIETLLKTSSQVLVFMIKEDKELYNDIEIQTILKLNGIDLEKDYGVVPNYKFDIKNVINMEKEKYLKEMYEPYYSGIIDDESQSLIDELRIVFEYDGKSDDGIIELACNTFKFMFLNNNKYAKRNLLALINIKNDNSNFVLVKGEKSFFKFPDIIISIRNKYNVKSFIHEFHHLFHYCFKNDEIPESFDRKKYIINDEKFASFLEIYRRLRKDIIKKFNRDYYSESYNAKKDMETYKNRCLNILEQAKDIYSDDIINYLKDNIPVEEDYKKQYNDEMISNIVHADNNLYLMSSIIDIIDALSKGIIYDKGFKCDDGILRVGHGSKYYGNEKNIFIEILAQYATLVNAPNSEYYINLLEGIVGHELIELLDDFYDNLMPNLVDKKQK